MNNLGAPIELRPDHKASTADTAPRITFLVNLWLSHHPHDVSQLPPDILQALTLPSVPVPLSIQLVPDNDSVHDFKISAKTTRDSAKMTELTVPFISEESSWGIGADETSLYLKMWMPRWVLLRPLLESKSSIHIVYTRPDVAASLEYELDENAENELADEFDGMVYCGEVSRSSGPGRKNSSKAVI